MHRVCNLPRILASRAIHVAEMSEISRFLVINGFKWPSHRLPVENFHNIQNLDFQDGDLVLNTFLKCGTFWTSYIIWSILNDGKPLPQPAELIKCMIFMDKFGVPAPNSYQFLASHVPPPHLPIKDCTKYVVTIRNPFDCCVSFYHFTKSKIVDHPTEIPFDQYFEIFLSGDMAYGDYFDHLLGWYQRRNDSNVKIMIYEEMIQDRKACVLQLAKFLGEEFFKKMEGETLDKILEHTSFDHMKTNLDFGALEIARSTAKGSEFIRKGIVGDWKTLFSEIQKERLKEKMMDKLRGTQILDYWLETLQL